jgi:hypothetical protein
MPVQFGIVCDRCRNLYLISPESKSAHIQYDRLRGEFKLVCVPPCRAVIYFSRGMLMPYMVLLEALERGYIEIDRCQPISERMNLHRSVGSGFL